MALIEDPLAAVFREVLRNDELELSEDLTLEDVREWDSVAHVNLIAEIEERFGVKFSVPEIMEMNSVGTIREALARKR
jgi:acyl carrier protein